MGPSYEPGQIVYARETHSALEASAPMVIEYVFFSQASHSVSYIVRDSQERYRRVPERALSAVPPFTRPLCGEKREVLNVSL